MLWTDIHHTPCPRETDTRAEKWEQAADAFDEHIRLHGPEWRHYEIQLHLGDGVLALTLDPPEPDE